MRKAILIAGLVGLVGAAGCGDSTTLNTAPLTEEEKRKIKEEDQRTEDEEMTGGTGEMPKKAKGGTRKPN